MSHSSVAPMLCDSQGFLQVPKSLQPLSSVKCWRRLSNRQLLQLQAVQASSKRVRAASAYRSGEWL